MPLDERRTQLLDAAFPADPSDLRTIDPRELITDITRAYLDGILAERNRWYCILLAADAGPSELRAAVAALSERDVQPNLLPQRHTRSSAAAPGCLNVTFTRPPTARRG